MPASQADICVICNPAAGRGRARIRMERLRRELAGRAEFRLTTGPGEAEALALHAAADGYPIVAAAGGDGTVHEVANGLLRSGKSEVIFAPIPVGSANDYVHSLGLADGWTRRPDGAVGPGWVDVGLVRSGARSRYFVNGFGAGFNGLVTRESRRIRRLRGLPLYGLAVLRVILFQYTTPATTVGLDDGPPLTTPTLGLSLAVGRREGNFVVAPQAVMDDGLFDYVHGGALTRWDLLVFMAQMAAQRLRTDHPLVRMGRCRRATLHSEAPLIVHTDGEFFCLPEDGLHDLEVDMLPRALRVFRQLT
ncbi:MAG TPA: diacylglycerol kinase family protein [Gemmataceae bacterium]|nr:diacylglycerol kinase family protein [Gemmataceae bacterium]